jgi:hypothetical protein
MLERYESNIVRRSRAPVLPHVILLPIASSLMLPRTLLLPAFLSSTDLIVIRKGQSDAEGARSRC